MLGASRCVGEEDAVGDASVNRNKGLAWQRDWGRKKKRAKRRNAEFAEKKAENEIGTGAGYQSLRGC